VSDNRIDMLSDTCIERSRDKDDKKIVFQFDDISICFCSFLNRKSFSLTAIIENNERGKVFFFLLKRRRR
jgi:hypothetical protein